MKTLNFRPHALQGDWGKPAHSHSSFTERVANSARLLITLNEHWMSSRSIYRAWPAHGSQRCPKPEPFFLHPSPVYASYGSNPGVFYKIQWPSFSSHAIVLTIWFDRCHGNKKKLILSFQYIPKGLRNLYIAQTRFTHQCKWRMEIT